MLESILFIIISVCIIIILSLILVYKLINKEQQSLKSKTELDIYRLQLDEISKDVQKGILSVAEEKQAKQEIKKRILRTSLNDEESVTEVSKNTNFIVTISSVGFFVISSFLLYYFLGSLGQPDQPIEKRLQEISEYRENRPSQILYEKSIQNNERELNYDKGYLNLIEQLRETVKKNNHDVNGLRLLVKYETSIKQFKAAYTAQKKLLDKLGANATSDDYTNYTQLLMNAANGYISHEAENSLTKALSLDKQNRRARYFAGLLMIQIKRPDLALNIWKGILTDTKIEDVWSSEIKKRILKLEVQAGLKNE